MNNRPAMTIAVDLGCKAPKQTKKNYNEHVIQFSC